MKVTDDRKNDRRRLRRPEVNRFLIGGSKNGDSQQPYSSHPNTPYLGLFNDSTPFPLEFRGFEKNA